MAINTNFPHGMQNVVCIPLIETRQVTADIAFSAGADVLVPFRCRVVGIVGVCAAIGGTTEFTDVDLNVRGFDGTTGVNLLSADIPVVNSSTLAEGGLAGTLQDTDAELTIEANERLQLDIDVTGGSSPTADGVGVYVYVVPID